MYNTTKILNGDISLSGDKSLSHRFLMIASLISDESFFKNIPLSKDVLATIDCLKKCHIDINIDGDMITVYGGTFKNPDLILDCKNSGSTVRMLMGLLFGQLISVKFTGDSSLLKRPMNRVMEPLKSMGASFLSSSGKLPIEMKSKFIQPFNFMEETKSAQVKTSLIFAGLGHENQSSIAYNKYTRNHTEKILDDLGFNINIGSTIKVRKSNISSGINILVPGDLSSAAFIIAAAIIIPGSNVTIRKVLYNKNRLAFIYALIEMGANITINNITQQEHGVQSCDIEAVYSKDLIGLSIDNGRVIAMIDEIPIFCIVACFAKGCTEIKNAKELRIKESDRISGIYKNLYNMKADIIEKEDGLIISGQKRLYNTTINHFDDHRIAMAFEIAKLSIGESMTYSFSDIIDVSFPGFYKIMDDLML